MEEISNLNIQETSKIDKDLPSSKKLGINQGISQENKKMENINSNSKYKNSFIIKPKIQKEKIIIKIRLFIIALKYMWMLHLKKIETIAWT